MHYDALMRDARNESLTASTRIRAAFDALYECCLRVVDTHRVATVNGEQFAQTVIERALSSIQLSPEDASLLRKLCNWALHNAPLPPLPMSTEDAIALAERVHKVLGEV